MGPVADVLQRQLQLGYLYKTFAQVAEARGRSDEAAAYPKQAEDIFRYVEVTDVPADEAAWPGRRRSTGEANDLEQVMRQLEADQ
ncbi:MAG: hypothetical protein QOI76_2171 [Frankiales bacterium]|nr:hypothetical protein [Frankiales bacterium]